MKEMAGRVKAFGESKEFHRVWKLVENIVFPLVLLLFRSEERRVGKEFT